MAQRAKFSRAVRKKIMLRDQGGCVLCGRPSNIIHHIKFRSQGGRGVESNGVVLCANCHNKVHQNNSLAERLRKYAESVYGADYYKDRIDMNECI